MKWIYLTSFTSYSSRSSSSRLNATRHFFFRTSLYCKHTRVYLSLPGLISTQRLPVSRWLDPPWIIYGANQLINPRAERKQNSFPGNVRQLSGKLSVFYRRLRTLKAKHNIVSRWQDNKQHLGCSVGSFCILLLFFLSLALVALLHLLPCPMWAFRCVCVCVCWVTMSAEPQHDMRDATRHSEQNYINDSAVPGPLWKADREEAKREMDRLRVWRRLWKRERGHLPVFHEAQMRSLFDWISKNWTKHEFALN